MTHALPKHTVADPDADLLADNARHSKVKVPALTVRGTNQKKRAASHRLPHGR